MHVVVITNDELKKELLEQTPSDQLQLQFIDRPDEFPVGSSADACIDLLFDGTKERSRLLHTLNAKITVINAVHVTLAETDPTFIRINAWPGFLKRELIEAAAVDADREAAAYLFGLFGKKTEWVPDICGFISARVVATIINEAFFALEENISTEKEIDTAMKLGTNYPLGPFEWAEKIGIKEIYTLLHKLSKDESRYIPCKLLDKKALA